MPLTPDDFIDLIKKKALNVIRPGLREQPDFDMNFLKEEKWEHDFDSMTRSVYGSGYSKKGYIHYAIDTGDISFVDSFSRLPRVNINFEYEYYDNRHESTVSMMGSGYGSSETNTKNHEFTPAEYALHVNQFEIAKLLMSRGSTIRPGKVNADALLKLINLAPAEELTSQCRALHDIAANLFLPAVPAPSAAVAAAASSDANPDSQGSARGAKRLAVAPP